MRGRVVLSLVRRLQGTLNEGSTEKKRMGLSICLFGACTLSTYYGPSTTRGWGYKAEETMPWPQRPHSLGREAANSLRARGVQWWTYRSLRWTEKEASLSVNVAGQSWIIQVKREADFKVGSDNVASSLESHCHIQDPQELQGTMMQSGTQDIISICGGSTAREWEVLYR